MELVLARGVGGAKRKRRIEAAESRNHYRPSMATNLSRYKLDLERLIMTGKDMFSDISFRHLATQRALMQQERESAKKVEGHFEGKYQRWYTEFGITVTVH